MLGTELVQVAKDIQDQKRITQQTETRFFKDTAGKKKRMNQTVRHKQFGVRNNSTIAQKKTM